MRQTESTFRVWLEGDSAHDGAFVQSTIDMRVEFSIPRVFNAYLGHNSDGIDQQQDQAAMPTEKIVRNFDHLIGFGTVDEPFARKRRALIPAVTVRQPIRSRADVQNNS